MHDDDTTGVGLWGLVTRAAASMTLGALCVFAPNFTLSLFVPLFATFAVVDGGASLAAADPRCWALALIGAVGLSSCLFCFFIPGAGEIGVVTAFGAWATAVGALELLASAQLRRFVPDEYFLALCGVAGIAVGIVAIASPVTAAPALLAWIGAYAICAGAFRLIVAVRLAPSALLGAPSPAR